MKISQFYTGLPVLGSQSHIIRLAFGYAEIKPFQILLQFISVFSPLYKFPSHLTFL